MHTGVGFAATCWGYTTCGGVLGAQRTRMELMSNRGARPGRWPGSKPGELGSRKCDCLCENTGCMEHRARFQTNQRAPRVSGYLCVLNAWPDAIHSARAQRHWRRYQLSTAQHTGAAAKLP